MSGADFTPEVEFSRPSGTVEEPFALILRSAATNAVIRYTVDGSFPTETNGIYGGPITISNVVQVRARAFAPGLLPSAPHSETLPDADQFQGECRVSHVLFANHCPDNPQDGQ